jgi:hypothetical protein
MYATSYDALMYPEPNRKSEPLRKQGYYIDDRGRKRPFKPLSLFKGEPVTVYEERDGWARVRFLGTIGWVESRFLWDGVKRRRTGHPPPAGLCKEFSVAKLQAIVPGCEVAFRAMALAREGAAINPTETVRETYRMCNQLKEGACLACESTGRIESLRCFPVD